MTLIIDFIMQVGDFEVDQALCPWEQPNQQMNFSRIRPFLAMKCKQSLTQQAINKAEGRTNDVSAMLQIRKQNIIRKMQIRKDRMQTEGPSVTPQAQQNRRYAISIQKQFPSYQHNLIKNRTFYKAKLPSPFVLPGSKQDIQLNNQLSNQSPAPSRQQLMLTRAILLPKGYSPARKVTEQSAISKTNSSPLTHFCIFNDNDFQHQTQQVHNQSLVFTLLNSSQIRGKRMSFLRRYVQGHKQAKTNKKQEPDRQKGSYRSNNKRVRVSVQPKLKDLIQRIKGDFADGQSRTKTQGLKGEYMKCMKRKNVANMTLPKIQLLDVAKES